MRYQIIKAVVLVLRITSNLENNETKLENSSLKWGKSPAAMRARQVHHTAVSSRLVRKSFSRWNILFSWGRQKFFAFLPLFRPRQVRNIFHEGVNIHLSI